MFGDPKFDSICLKELQGVLAAHGFVTRGFAARGFSQGFKSLLLTGQSLQLVILSWLSRHSSITFLRIFFVCFFARLQSRNATKLELINEN